MVVVYLLLLANSFLKHKIHTKQQKKKTRCAHGDEPFICANAQHAVINLNDDYGPFLIFNDSFCLMDLRLTATM